MLLNISKITEPTWMNRGAYVSSFIHEYVRVYIMWGVCVFVHVCHVRGRLAWSEVLTSSFHWHQSAWRKQQNIWQWDVDLHEETWQEIRLVSFSCSGIWNPISDITEKLPSDLCWVHSLAAQHVWSWHSLSLTFNPPRCTMFEKTLLKWLLGC